MKTVSSIAYWGNVIIITLFVAIGVVFSISERDIAGMFLPMLYMGFFGGLWQLLTSFVILLGARRYLSPEMRLALYIYWIAVIAYFTFVGLTDRLGWSQNSYSLLFLFGIPVILYTLHFYYTAKFRNHD